MHQQQPFFKGRPQQLQDLQRPSQLQLCAAGLGYCFALLCPCWALQCISTYLEPQAEPDNMWHRRPVQAMTPAAWESGPGLSAAPLRSANFPSWLRTGFAAQHHHSQSMSFTSEDKGSDSWRPGCAEAFFDKGPCTSSTSCSYMLQACLRSIHVHIMRDVRVSCRK